MVDAWGFTDWTQYFKRRTRNSNKNPHQNPHWQIKLVENNRRSLSISYSNLNVREDNTSRCNPKSFCKIQQQFWKKSDTSDGSEWLKLFFLLCRMAVAQTGTNLMFCLFVCFTGTHAACCKLLLKKPSACALLSLCLLQNKSHVILSCKCFQLFITSFHCVKHFLGVVYMCELGQAPPCMAFSHQLCRGKSISSASVLWGLIAKKDWKMASVSGNMEHICI